MIRSRRSVITVLTILFIFSLPLIFGCPGPESKKTVEKPPFSGIWDIRETRTGCGEEKVIDYSIEITQNNNIFTLGVTEGEGTFSVTCRLNADNELLCGGNFRYSDGYYSYASESYNLWFNDENNENKLMGDGDWTYHPQDGDACNGGSVLSATRVNN